MKVQASFFIAAIFLLASCSPKIGTSIIKDYPRQDVESEIVVFDIDDQIIEQMEILGSVKVGDKGLTIKCGYDIMMNLVKEEARKMGGNAVRIIRHRPPDLMSSCHRFEAQILLVNWDEESASRNPDTIEVERQKILTLDPDIIVFTNGDSINCKILEVRSDDISYSFKNDLGEYTSTAPIARIQNYVKNYNRPEIAAAELEKQDYSPVRFNLYGSYSFMPGKIDEDYTDFYKDYLKGLKRGWSAGADICFFIRHNWGLGIKYYQFFSNGFYGNVSMEKDGETVYGNLSNKIRSTFIGPTYTSRYVSQKNGNTFYISLGLGYLDYSDDGEAVDQKYLLSGKTLGSVLDIGYDFALKKNFAFGIQLSGISGTLSEIQEEIGGVITTYDLGVEEMIGVASFDVSASLKYNF